MILDIDDSDWAEVFKYASFSREDVIESIAQEDGDNDGPNWIGLFCLQNGKYGVVRAGCDYTGWG